MGKLQIKPSDLKAGKIVKPGWHVVEITNYVEELNKNKDANNHVFDFVGVSADCVGVPFKIWISEKAPAILGGPLVKALGQPVNDDEGISIDFQKENLVGKKVKANIVTGSYNNRPKNEITDFAPV
jgi:hypothetical protein